MDKFIKCFLEWMFLVVGVVFENGCNVIFVFFFNGFLIVYEVNWIYLEWYFVGVYGFLYFVNIWVFYENFRKVLRKSDRIYERCNCYGSLGG